MKFPVPGGEAKIGAPQSGKDLRQPLFLMPIVFMLIFYANLFLEATITAAPPQIINKIGNAMLKSPVPVTV